ncbi:hypothetical protein KSP40_PGU022532 [Platanthera guangdongensis]|uniref:RRM domain-containing protein n=1 Tax=Platanthera guangdongensis TaxID=2320717 RepID=A0ABR2MB88_9ASPA
MVEETLRGHIAPGADVTETSSPITVNLETSKPPRRPEKELPPTKDRLSRLTTDEKLKEAFSPYGQLLEAKVIADRVSGRSKGFAFVSYATIEEADKARYAMNAKFLDGWVIFVDPAKPKERKPLASSSEPEVSETGFRTNKTIGWCG